MKSFSWRNEQTDVALMRTNAKDSNKCAEAEAGWKMKIHFFPNMLYANSSNIFIETRKKKIVMNFWDIISSRDLIKNTQQCMRASNVVHNVHSHSLYDPIRRKRKLKIVLLNQMLLYGIPS